MLAVRHMQAQPWAAALMGVVFHVSVDSARTCGDWHCDAERTAPSCERTQHEHLIVCTASRYVTKVGEALMRVSASVSSCVMGSAPVVSLMRHGSRQIAASALEATARAGIAELAMPKPWHR
jgi:hypothetical protein